MTKRGVSIYPVDAADFRPASLSRLGQALRGFKPDIIHAHDLRSALMAQLSAPKHRPQTLIHIHSRPMKIDVGPLVERVMKRWMLGHSGPVLASTHALRETMISSGDYDFNRVEVMHGGIPDIQPLHREASRRRYAVDAKTPLVVALATLNERKGVPTLLEAVSLLPDVHLLIAGDGPLRQELERMVQVLDLADRTRLLGYVRDVPTLLAASDLFVAPGMPTESFPLVCVEAHRAGRPTVCFEGGAMSEVVQQNQTGSLLESTDPGRLAKAIESLLTDPDARERMGQEGRRQFLQNWELEGYLDRLDWVYQQM
jgi:glycosyltransferase involved in cell wall biosynthesis